MAFTYINTLHPGFYVFPMELWFSLSKTVQGQ